MLAATMLLTLFSLTNFRAKEHYETCCYCCYLVVFHLILSYFVVSIYHLEPLSIACYPNIKQRVYARYVWYVYKSYYIRSEPGWIFVFLFLLSRLVELNLLLGSIKMYKRFIAYAFRP